MTNSIEIFEAVHNKFKNARNHVAEIIIGQQRVIDDVFITLLAGGHGLLVGVPGLGKTLLVKTVAQILGLETTRIQCTPDLMPSDVTGTEILEVAADGTRQFRFIKGPVFAQLLMVDEINRASPKTQSALLEAMQEKAVTVSGKPYALPTPFHVLATQNPIEQEGTYPLPEAQLDRFLMEILMTYPTHDAEREMVLNTTGTTVNKPRQLLGHLDLITAQNIIKDMPVGENILNAIIKIVRAARPAHDSLKEVNDHMLWAPGPRASQALMMTARARAFLDGRTTASMDDVIALAKPVLRHRMRLKPRSKNDGVTTETIIEAICAQL